MQAIILSAGQGKRLLPLTQRIPKCMLHVGPKRLVEWQVDCLLDGGFDRIQIVTGYAANDVARVLRSRYSPAQVTTLFNPFFNVSDNLASCWMARHEMTGPFLLINGDTLFHPTLLASLTSAPSHPITVTVDRKPHYDADDMKVALDGDRLSRIGKDLPAAEVAAESIGMLRFDAAGAELFRSELEVAMYNEDGLRRWFLSAIDRIAGDGVVFTHCIAGCDWSEVDYPADLERARRMVANWLATEPLGGSIPARL